MSLPSQIQKMLDSRAKNCIGLCTRNTYENALDHLSVLAPPEAVFRGDYMLWKGRTVRLRKLEEEPLPGAELFLLIGTEDLDPAEKVGYGRWLRT